MTSHDFYWSQVKICPSCKQHPSKTLSLEIPGIERGSSCMESIFIISLEPLGCWTPYRKQSIGHIPALKNFILIVDQGKPVGVRVGVGESERFLGKGA